MPKMPSNPRYSSSGRGAGRAGSGGNNRVRNPPPGRTSHKKKSGCRLWALVMVLGSATYIGTIIQGISNVT